MGEPVKGSATSVIWPIKAKGIGMCKKFDTYTFLFFVFCLVSNAVFADMGGAGASSDWGKIQKKIVIRSGLSISAWDDKDERADVTYSQYGVRAVTMTPVGDGTYSIKVDLIPGMSYNFALFAFSTQTIQGIQKDWTYYDPVPNSGSDIAFITSTSPYTPVFNNTFSAGYISIGGDARRYVQIPEWITPGTTFYVYCNWASTPTVIENFRAFPGNGFIRLEWDEPYAYWGKGDESYKAIDVIVGGSYNILRATSPGGPYEIVASTPGYCFNWTDNSVENGKTYYYAIFSSDAYKGSKDGTLADINLVSEMTYSVATPGEPIPVRFRVENVDWKYIEKNGFVVWLTPENILDRYSSEYKIPARVVRVYVPKTLKDRINDLLKLFSG